MKIKRPVVRILAATIISVVAGLALEFAGYWMVFPIQLFLATFAGVCSMLIIEFFIYCRRIRIRNAEAMRTRLQTLPADTARLLTQIIKKMRYRRSVRKNVMAELAAHFQDALGDFKTADEREQEARRLIDDFGDVKLLAILLRRAKKRCRPLWRTAVARSFQTIGVLVLCFIVYCVYISSGKPTIRVNYVEELTRIARPVADEILNAAPLYQKAIAAYVKPPELEVETVRALPPHHWRYQDSNGPGKDFRKSTQKADLLGLIHHNQWVDDLRKEELDKLREWVSNNTEAMEFFKQASLKPHCWWQREAKDDNLLAVLMPELSPLKAISILLCWNAKLKAYNGDIDGAFEDVLTCYRVGKHYKGPRSLIEQLVATAIQAISVNTSFVILSNKQTESQKLQNFQQELENLMTQDFLTINYRTERFNALDFLQKCYTDNGRGSGHMIPGQVREYFLAIYDPSRVNESELADYARSLLMALAGADRQDMHTELEKVYRTCEQWAMKTPFQLRGEKVDLEMGIDKWSHFKRARYWPVAALAPALANIAALSNRSKCQVEALVTTTAILRYRQLQGHYPENLQQLLDAGLLKSLPMDPYSAGTLVYKKTEDGFSLYSLGADFDDDGGTPSKWGQGQKGGDQVFWPVRK